MLLFLRVGAIGDGVGEVQRERKRGKFLLKIFLFILRERAQAGGVEGVGERISS